MWLQGLRLQTPVLDGNTIYLVKTQTSICLKKKKNTYIQQIVNPIVLQLLIHWKISLLKK